MKTKIYLLVIVVLSFGIGLISDSWSQTEAVKGYYDQEKEWFVFEWDRPGYGKTTTFYDPPNKVNPVIKTKVFIDTENQIYIYNYEVTNQIGAKQPLFDIIVKYLSPIYDAKSPEPSDDWHMAQYRGKDAWHWAKTGGEIHGILSGQTEIGFSFKSKGLPTLVNAVFLGHERAIYSPPGDYDTDEVEDSFERVMKNLEEQYKEKFEYVVKKVIGPKDPPADFKPVEFLDNIISMKHEAASLGWITNKGIENSLDAKLDNAKKKLDQGNVLAAKNILEAFINEVEAQNGKHLTSEAYALLKYNVQYLIEKL